MENEAFYNLTHELYDSLRSGDDVYALKLRYHKKDPHQDPAVFQKALETAEGRINAEKLNIGQWSAQGLFTKIGLQQSTHPAIAAHHAQKFSGCKHVLEICTGLGFDTAALSKASSHVTSIEPDEWVVSCAAHNLKVQNITNVKLVSSTAEAFVGSTQLSQFDGIWADPSRRVEGKRTKDTALYQPALDWILSLPISGPIGVKISPAVDVADLPSECTREWIGYGTECREQVLWLRADVPEGLVSLVDKDVSWFPKQIVSPDEILSELPDGFPFYLVEPHGALSRSGGLTAFYAEQGITLIEEDLVYGFSQTNPKLSPWYEVFEVFEYAPLSRKKLTEKVAALGWNSRTEIKKRNIADDPDEVFRALKLPKPDAVHTEYGVILLTTIHNSPVVFFAKRVTSDGA